jgi:hypothetical protein
LQGGSPRQDAVRRVAEAAPEIRRVDFERR